MPITIPQTFIDEGERPQQDQTWIWLLQIQAELFDGSNTPVLFRFTNYKEELVWPIGVTPTQTWYPFPFEFSGIETSGEGNLPQLEMAVDNSTRLLMDLLHEQHGFEGNPAVLHLVNEAGKDIASPNEEGLTWNFTIVASSATDESVALRFETKNWFEVKTPADRFTAARCRWQFGDPATCGYIINSGAAFTDCNKTVSDCILRGQDEASRGLPVLHPRRFGGFPGIPRQRAL